MKVCPQCKQRFPDDSSFCYADGSALDPLPEPIGTTVANRYVLTDVVGKGHFAVVYRARDQFLGRNVAVKIFAGGTAGQDEALRHAQLKADLQRSVTHAQRLVHPNALVPFEVGETEGSVYFVSELLDGAQSLATVMQKPIPLPKAVDMGLQIARAITRAHDFAVIHADLRPTNIFVRKDGRVLVSDFSVGRASDGFRAPGYVAPEQQASFFGDLYSLGVVLFELTTYSRPFDAQDRETLVHKNRTEVPPRISQRVQGAPAELDELVFSLMAKTPMGRPVSGHAVLGQLSTAAEQLGVTSTVPALDPLLRGAGTDLDETAKKWKKRLGVFEDMVKRGFPNGPPAHVAKMAEELARYLRMLEEVRASSSALLEQLEIIDQEACDGLSRMGDAMSTVMQDASSLRQQVRAAQGAVGQDLATQLSDIDYQVKELRNGIEALLTDREERRAGPNRELAELGRRFEEADGELLNIAARFSAPLRARPELATMFAALAS